MTVRSFSLGCAALVAGLSSSGTATGADWRAAGYDLRNSRFQPNETQISARNVRGLRLRWEVTTVGDVTATPAIDGDYLYVPDSGGWLYKVERMTGVIAWQRRISDYTGIPGDFARATPAIAGNALILGNQSGKFLGANFGQPQPQPARVFALDKNTGAPLWNTQVDGTALSFVTQSAVVANGLAIVGVASNEELVAAFVPKAFWQWQFRGSVVALDVATGAIRWQTYMVPTGYTGGALWGNTPAVDVQGQSVYVATGNNYSLPDADLACIKGGGSPAACMSATNHFDSIVALDLATGAIRWASRGLSYDAWNVGCGLSVPGFVVPAGDNCPDPAGPDWDFAQGPMLMGEVNGDKVVGAGQKSGMFWTFKAKTGQLAWATQVAPGGLTGGLQWGSASDGQRIYVAASNSGPTGAAQAPGVWTLKDGTTTTAGGWAALDRKTGALLWTTQDPNGSRAEGAVSVANGVLFGCNMSTNGTMYALEAKTGSLLWSYDSGGPCNAGPSIADGMVFWGTGTFNGYGPRKLFAFGL